MAKKTDIPLTYRQLQKANAEQFQIDPNELGDFATLKIKAGPSPMAFVHEGPEKSSIMQKGTSDYWGNSIFDADTATPEEYFSPYGLSDARAENQPLLAKWGSAIGNGAVLAATTFADGTAGLLYGIGSAIANQRWSDIWDNEVSNGLQELNRIMEELVMPFYKTLASQEKPWWEKLGSVDFWADGFLKNMGFTIGAAYSGGVFSKALKAIGLLKNASTLGAKLAGGIYSAVNEGRILANNNAYDTMNNISKILDLSRADLINKINSNPYLSLEEKNRRLSQVDKNYYNELLRADNQVRDMGMADMIMNIPLLALDNFYTFGKFYTKGFDTAKQTTRRGILGRLKDAYIKGNELSARETPITEGLKQTGRDLAKDAKYVWNKKTTGQGIKAGLLDALREGHEEIAQDYIDELTANNYTDSPDSYYRAVSNPKTKRDTMNFMQASAKAFMDSYGNKDKYEEFAIGALTGLLGTPTFGRVQNADANTYLGRGKMVGLSNGIFGELASNREANRRGQETANQMNKLVSTVLKNADDLAKNIMLRKSFQDAMDGWAAQDDKFEYKNAEDNSIWRQINAFLSAGRKDDLLSLIAPDVDNMSDEALDNIIKMTSPNGTSVNDLKDTTGWRNANGNYRTDYANIRAELKKKSEQFKKDIDSYEKALSTVRAISNNDVNRNEDEVSELAWMLWKANKFNDRAKELGDENKVAFSHVSTGIQGLINAFKDSKVAEIDTSSLSPTEKQLIDLLNEQGKKKNENLEKNIEFLKDVHEVMSQFAEGEKVLPLMRNLIALKDYREFLDDLSNNQLLAEALEKQGVDKTESQGLFKAMSDIAKMATAQQEFQNKFEEYSENPLKQKANRQKIERQQKKEQLALKNVDLRARALNISMEDLDTLEPDEFDSLYNSLTDDDKEAKKKFESYRKNQKRLNKMGGILSELLKKSKNKKEQQVLQQALNALSGVSPSLEEHIPAAAFMAAANSPDGTTISDETLAKIDEAEKLANEEIERTESLGSPAKQQKDIDDIDLKKVEGVPTETPEDTTLITEAAMHAADIVETEMANLELKLAEKGDETPPTDTTGRDAVEKLLSTNPEELKEGKPKKKEKETGNKNKKESLSEYNKDDDTMKKEKEYLQKKLIDAASERKELSDKEKEGLKRLSNTIYNHIIKGEASSPAAVVRLLKGDNDYNELIGYRIIPTEIISNHIKESFSIVKDGLPIPFKEDNEEIKPKTEEEEAKEDKESQATLEQTIGPLPPDSSSPNPNDDTDKSKEDLHNLNQENTAATDDDTQQIIGSWRPNIDEFGHKKSEKVFNQPFHEYSSRMSTKQKQATEAVYNYLKEHGAFDNVKSLSVGDKVYFVVDSELNKKIQESSGDKNAMVVLMASDVEGNNIIGSLPIRLSSDPFASYEKDANMDKFYTFAEEAASNQTKKVVLSKTSAVKQLMGGSLLYGKNYNYLKDLLGEHANSKGIKLGVVNSKGQIIDNNGMVIKADHIKVGKNTVGAPVILFKTVKGNYRAALLRTDRFTKADLNTEFGKRLNGILLDRILTSGIKNLRLPEEQRNLKDILMSIYGVDLRVTVITKKVGTQQVEEDGRTVTKNVSRASIYVYRTLTNEQKERKRQGVSSDTLFKENILWSCQSENDVNAPDRIKEIHKEIEKGTTGGILRSLVNTLATVAANDNAKIRINKNLLNTVVSTADENGDEVEIDYNKLMSSKLSSDLLRMETVNDWFTINELDGNLNTIDSPKSKEEEKKGPETPKSISVEYNGTTYNVTTEGNLLTADGKDTNLSTKQQSIIKAIAAIESGTVLSPAFKGTDIYVVNGKYFDMGKKEFVSKEEAEKKREPEKVIKTDKEEKEEKQELPKWAKTTIGRQVWDKANKEQRWRISQIKKSKAQKFLLLILKQAAPADFDKILDENLVPKYTETPKKQDATENKKTSDIKIPSQEEIEKGTTFHGFPEGVTNVVYDIDDDAPRVYLTAATGDKFLVTYNRDKHIFSLSLYDKEFNTYYRITDENNPSGEGAFFRHILDRYLPKEFFEHIKNTRSSEDDSLWMYDHYGIILFHPDIVERSTGKIKYSFKIRTPSLAKALKEKLHKNRLADNNYEQADINKEVEWLKKALPLLSTRDRLKVVHGLIEASSKGDKAWGQFKDGIITLSDGASKGTVYHEAWHAVFDTMLNDREKQGLYREARLKWGSKSPLELEEEMAEDFRRYTQKRQEAGIGRRILNFFKDLWNTIAVWRKNKNSLEDFYRRINKGGFANARMSNVLDRRAESDIIAKSFPGMKVRNQQRILNSLIKTIKNKKASTAILRFNNARASLSDSTPKGIVGHQAFHNAITVVLNSDERASLYQAGALLYKIDIQSEDAVMKVEEQLAKDFIDYRYQGIRPESKTIENLFEDIKETLDNIDRNQILLVGTMSRISNKDIEESQVTTEQEFKDIQSQLYNLYMQLVYKRDLSEDDIDNVNDLIRDLLNNLDSDIKWQLMKDNRNQWYIAGRDNESVTSEDYKPSGIEERNTLDMSLDDGSVVTDYYNKLYDYHNLDSNYKTMLESRGITEEEYDKLTLREKEGLKRCML